MKLDFTTNAQARLAERGIREADIQTVLEAPDHLSPFLEKHWHAKKRLDQRTLEVIFARDPLQVLVLTAFWKEVA
jgi:hypothetical protein